MEVVHLNKVQFSQVSKVFEEEIKCWQTQLFWDYRPAVNTLEKHLSNNSLPGFALSSGEGILVGYSYYMVGYPTGYIGNLYEKLLVPTIQALRSSYNIQRIESQIFAFNCELTHLFKRQGFEAESRDFLCQDLSRLEEHQTNETVGCSSMNGFQILPWKDIHLAPSADVVYDSYQTSTDFHLCRDYQSREGCLRFLLNLIDSPGCGSFSSQTSQVALDEKGNLCGILLASKIGPETGMVPQISVRRKYQGKGVGKSLLSNYFQRARENGLQRVVLSVTASNPAYRLYSRMGFKRTKRFHAFIWNR